MEQVAAVVGINIDLLRSLNPMYRRDVIPGATEPMPLRLPQSEVGKFIDMADSVYNYKADELLSKRSEVEIKEDAPTYYRKSTSTYKKKTTRAKRGRRAPVKRRSTARRTRRRR